LIIDFKFNGEYSKKAMFGSVKKRSVHFASRIKVFKRFWCWNVYFYQNYEFL